MIYSGYKRTCVLSVQVVLGKKNKEKPSSTVHINMTLAPGEKI